nr:glutenin, high molecular weight subunit PW212-like isoform X2 [Penaeus vannamei]
MLYVESTKPSYFSGEGKCCGGEGEEEDAGEGDEGEVRLEGGGGDQPAEGVRLEGGGGGQPEEGKRRHQRETEEKGSRNQTSRDRVRGQDAGHEHSLQRQGGRGKRPEEGEGRPDARDRKKGRGDQRAKGPGEEGAKGPAKGRERGRGREGRLQGANRRPRGTQCVSPEAVAGAGRESEMRSFFAGRFSPQGNGAAPRPRGAGPWPALGRGQELGEQLAAATLRMQLPGTGREQRQAGETSLGKQLAERARPGRHRRTTSHCEQQAWMSVRRQQARGERCGKGQPGWPRARWQPTRRRKKTATRLLRKTRPMNQCDFIKHNNLK